MILHLLGVHGPPWTTMKYGHGRWRPECPNCTDAQFTFNSLLHQNMKFIKVFPKIRFFFLSKIKPCSWNCLKMIAIVNESMKMQILSWTLISKFPLSTISKQFELHGCYYAHFCHLYKFFPHLTVSLQSKSLRPIWSSDIGNKVKIYFLKITV